MSAGTEFFYNIKNHPVRRVYLVAPFVIATIVTAVALMLELNGVITRRLSERVISELAAPLNVEILLSIALAVITGRIAFFGPFETLSGRIRPLVVALPNFAFGLAACLAGVILGYLSVLWVYREPLRPFIEAHAWMWFILVALICYLYLLVINLTTSPYRLPFFQSERVMKSYRFFAGLFCVLVVGRLIARLVQLNMLNS